MANDDELELDTESSSKKSGKGKMIIIIVLVVLVITGSVIGGLYFTGVLGGKSSSNNDSEHAVDDAEKELVVKKAFYINMQPAFIVNFEEQGEAAFLQIEMQAMTYDNRVTDEMTKHKPVIRNNILLILSAQKFEEVRTREGKENLQKQVLVAVQEIVGESMAAMLKEDGDEPEKGELVPNVEQIYFTSFIMQ